MDIGQDIANREIQYPPGSMAGADHDDLRQADLERLYIALHNLLNRREREPARTEIHFQAGESATGNHGSPAIGERLSARDVSALDNLKDQRLGG